MKIPVLPSDLENSKPFTRVARHIQGKWPNKINLSKAQNILSECLGYRDLHEVTCRIKKPTDLLSLKVVNQVTVAAQIRNTLHVRYGLSTETIEIILSDAPINLLSCTQKRAGSNYFDLLVKSRLIDTLKSTYFSGVDKPVVIGLPFRLPGFYSVQEVLEAFGPRITTSDPSKTISSILQESRSLSLKNALSEVGERVIKSLLHWPSSHDPNLIEDLVAFSGMTEEATKQYLNSNRSIFESSLREGIQKLNQLTLRDFYKRYRNQHGFYDRVYTIRSENSTSTMVSDGFFYLNIGEDTESYDSLPWNLHGVHSHHYDKYGVMSSCIEAYAFDCKGTYRIDDSDLAYAADHISDSLVPLANQAMSQIKDIYGEMDGYEHVFDNSVCLFVFDWERRGDAPRGAGVNLLAKVLRGVKKKFRKPIFLFVNTSPASINGRMTNIEFVKDEWKIMSERVLSSANEAASKSNSRSEVTLEVFPVEMTKCIADLQSSIYELYKNR